jgi:DNA repair protein RadC
VNWYLTVIGGILNHEILKFNTMKVSEIKVSYSNTNRNRIKITKSEDVFDIAKRYWNIDTIELKEEAKVLLLNRANIVIGIYNLSTGGVTACIIDIKLILSVALKSVASSIIMIHNHPSGNLKPSKADIEISKKLKEAASILDLVLLDHLIISKEDFYSLSDNADF